MNASSSSPRGRPRGSSGWEGRKGEIRLGADGDLVVVDPDAQHVIRGENVLSKCDWTALDGRAVTGAPRMTIRRGEIAMEEGRVIAEPGSGRFVVQNLGRVPVTRGATGEGPS